MEKSNRWPARVALLVSMIAFGATLGAFDALGMTSGTVPMALQTSSSPSKSASPSPSESECEFAPAPPPICPEDEESPTPSGSPSPSGSGGTGETEKHDSRVTIDHNSAGFHGTVNSAAKCERQRQVLVKKVRRGPDRLIGKDQTSTSGQWVVPHQDTRRGRYYAKVLKRVFTQGDTQVTCRGDRSDTVRVI